MRDKDTEHRDRDKEYRGRDRDREKEKERDKERESDSREKPREKDRERERSEKEGAEREREVPRQSKENNAATEDNSAFEKKGGAADLSLSVDETNKLRAKLGLPPLNVDSGPSKDELAKQQKEREEMEKEAMAIELTDKIERMRNKRLLTAKMAGKSIAEGIFM